jgi:hypothetical protein
MVGGWRCALLEKGVDVLGLLLALVPGSARFGLALALVVVRCLAASALLLGRRGALLVLPALAARLLLWRKLLRCRFLLVLAILFLLLLLVAILAFIQLFAINSIH